MSNARSTKAASPTRLPALRSRTPVSGVGRAIGDVVIAASVDLHTNAGGIDRSYNCRTTHSLFCTQAGNLQPVRHAIPDGGAPLLGTGSERVLDTSIDPDHFAEKFSRL